MDVVQVNDIRVYLVQAIQEFCGIAPRIETHAVMQAGHDTVDIYLRLGRAAQHMIVNGLMTPAPKAVGIDSV